MIGTVVFRAHGDYKEKTTTTSRIPGITDGRGKSTRYPKTLGVKVVLKNKQIIKKNKPNSI